MSNELTKVISYVWGKDNPIKKGEIEINRGGVFVGSQKVPEDLAVRLRYLIENKLPTDSFKKFIINLYKNPLPACRQNLYRFLSNNGHPITKDGMFIAYKKVKENFKDSYTGTIDNSVGTVVVMDRNKVNPDPNETCSHGLHVACWEYAKGYEGQVLLEVEVNPEHVVSIPNDYNHTKMRVCQYKVLRVTTEPSKENVITEEAKKAPKKMPQRKTKKVITKSALLQLKDSKTKTKQIIKRLKTK